MVLVACLLSVPLAVTLSPAEPSRAPQKPDHNGPYQAAWRYESFNGSTKSYSNTLKIYYPGASAAENATADPAGAPYPTVIMLPFMTGTVEVYNGNAPRMASWGMVLVVFGVNWNDATYSANTTDLNELLDQLEAENGTSGHMLHGMVDSSGYGISGISAGGAKSVIAGRFVSRIAAVEANGPALVQSDTDIIANGWNRPIQVQVGTADTTYRPYGVYIYNKLPGTRMLLDIVGGGHTAPYMWDDVISFFFRYLRNDTGYDEYLYRFGTMDDIANGTYFLNYTTAEGERFPGNLTIGQPSPAAIPEDGTVSLSAGATGYWPLGHPRGAFSWDFDSDGNMDHSDPVNLTASAHYTKSGSKKVTLFFTLGNCRIAATNNVFVTVENLPPAINLTSDSYWGNEGARLDFQVEVNDTPSDRAGLMVMWDFGDGGTAPYAAATGASHTYVRSGNITLRATVKDTDGASASATAAITISNLPPTAAAGDDLQALEEEELTFRGTGGDTPGDLPSLQFRWEFGDGAATEWSGDPGAVHAYRRSGNYTATFRARDGDGAEASSTLRVRVNNVAPRAAISEPRPNKEFQKDEAVVFDGSGSDTAGDLPSLRFCWDFGDGTRSNWSAEARAEHTYTSGGRFRAVLRVSDDDGELGESSANLSVQNQPPTLSVRSPKAAEVNEDQKVLFAAAADDTDSDRPHLNFTWVIDGREYDGSEVEVVFATAGRKAYAVTVSDPEGANTTASGELNVRNLAPKLTASVAPAAVLVNESVNFTASATDTPSDIPLLKIKWDFGDGTSAADLNGTHVYARPGAFTVVATLTDDQGQKATQSFTVSVAAPPAPPPPIIKDEQKTKLDMKIVYIGGGLAVAAVAGIAAFLVRRRRGPAANAPPPRPPSAG